ncbi:laminin subunit beta-4 [Haplochromis burtoni]|uniref:laminin subunit beta-4 n=1 Tax=Haplochromis burtoni TaxID=8153 RepID=UPI001C2CD06B|nr:laminin subunit beta-4 [Haplochromis burtoni]
MASGPLCDRCLPDFWGLGNSVFRCSPCNCDIGGAHSSTCSPEDGQCRCLPNMIGRRCSDPAPGYFLPPLNYFLYEAELTFPLLGGRSSTTPPPSPSSSAGPSSSSLLNPGVLPQCEQYFKKQGFDTKFQNGRVILVRRARQLAQQQKMRKRLQQTSIPLVPGYTLQIIPRQRASHQPVTWTGLGLVRVFEGVGLRFTVDNLPSSTDYQLAISYEPESASDWMAIVSIGKVSPGDGGCSSNPTGSKTVILPGNSRRGILDSLLCLNAGGQYFVDVTFYKQPRSDSSHILIDSIILFNRIRSVQNFCSQSDLDTFHQFPCTGLAVKPGPQESLPEVCEGLIVSLSAQIHNGAVLCRCNVIGSTEPFCSKLGGFCDCKANVIGRCCDACAPMTFGFGPEGCKRCDCDPHGSVSELCDQVSGQCACRSEITGQRCKRCQMGFWRFPSCRSCECNGLSEVCDGFTGDCLNCREHTTGPSCERCVEGYYGDPSSRQACQPCLCPDVLSSGRFFATSCQHDPQSLRLICKCQEGHTGVSCDSCSPGFYGDLTLPGAVCKECPCNNNIDPDDPNSCNSTTGECLHCLHNTIGLHCQHCKSGYHGNALNQDCKECSCDRRGTQETRCPLGRPCFCDPRTGQCPCRTGVIGKLCDECEDRYWNLNIASGCQPCSCDLIKSISNICDKVTGHCPCHPEFGGRHCDECRENHFRNPDLQCICE